jgi:hypothetical protein
MAEETFHDVTEHFHFAYSHIYLERNGVVGNKNKLS